MIDVNGSSNALPVLLARQSVDASTVELKLRIQPELVWFDGHFPKAPILPGVVQLNWVRIIAASIWSEHALWLNNASQLETIKFQQIIRPGDEVFLNLHIQPDRKRIQFKYFAGQSNFASGRLAASL